MTPNRRKLSMTWRTEIRTPGLPSVYAAWRPAAGVPGRHRGRSGVEQRPLGRIADLFTSPESYCSQADSRYLFFAERALFSVTLVSGTRRETLPIDKLYAMASDDPGLKRDLPYCDCEVLVDRTYFLPLGDKSWPDDTQVEFEYMDDPP